MSKLLTAICLIKETFDKYAKGEGDESTLTKGELTQLIKKELLGDVSRTKCKITDVQMQSVNNKENK
uniref:S100/CaBP-9k-type calcium binding subdomain domain-containing protein n=1 Tax=Cyclopterus lumpus TaxID=8103 RepID=A0A8C3G0V9_CYCLU